MREVCAYWADVYDWRATERRLNAFAQFKTDIDGLDVLARIRQWSDIPIIVLTADGADRRKVAALEPDLFVNITNDAWFGPTDEPYQHLALAVFRAVEHRTPMVRAVNTGVSAAIDANGRVLAFLVGLVVLFMPLFLLPPDS